MNLIPALIRRLYVHDTTLYDFELRHLLHVLFLLCEIIMSIIIICRNRDILTFCESNGSGFNALLRHDLLCIMMNSYNLLDKVF